MWVIIGVAAARAFHDDAGGGRTHRRSGQAAYTKVGAGHLLRVLLTLRETRLEAG